MTENPIPKECLILNPQKPSLGHSIAFPHTSAVKLGIISDTHGTVPAAVHAALAGVDHILHAGDVGPVDIITELEAIAPITAVRGNTDFAIDLPETRLIEIDGK